MARLPIVDGDNNNWGTILNEYLEVAHQADGTQNAEDVVNVPAGSISSTNVQAAIDELAGMVAGGSGFYPTTTVTGAYTATTDDQVIFADATSGTYLVTLPSPVGIEGKVFTVRKIDSSTNIIDVRFQPGNTLDGIVAVPTRWMLRRQWETITVISDGTTNWNRLDMWSKDINGSNTATATGAGHVYVSSDRGNDSYSGHWPWAPKATVQAGVNVSGARFIHIDAGTYTESVTLTSRQHLLGVDDVIAGSVVIRAPNATADVLNLSTENKVSNVSLQGYASGGWTGRCVVIDNGAGGSKLTNVVCGNTIALPFKGHVGGVDPVTGGTGIFIENSERNMFERVYFYRLRLGVDIGGPTFGASSNIFRHCIYTECWKEAASSAITGGTVFEMHKSAGDGYSCSRDAGFQWEMGGSGFTYIQCDLCEAGAGAIRWYGNHCTFINCTSSPSTKWYVEGKHNTFIGCRFQNDLILDGNWNTVENVEFAQFGNIQIYGNNNTVRGWLHDASDDQAVNITDYGIGTIIETTRRGVAAPAAGYGYRVGDIIWNDDLPISGAPMGWMCSVEALGPPQTQTGTWVSLEDGTTEAPK
jgi:hypothetical protein